MLSNKKGNWGFVLSKEASITEKEAAKIKEMIKIFEKEYGFD